MLSSKLAAPPFQQKRGTASDGIIRPQVSEAVKK